MHPSRLAAMLTFAVLTSTAIAQAPAGPIVAVAADGNTASAAVAPQLGRSPYFLLYESHGKLVEALSNPYKDAGNAGIPAVELLAGKGVKVVVAQGFGGQITAVIQGKGMRAMQFSGSASSAAAAALMP